MQNEQADIGHSNFNGSRHIGRIEQHDSKPERKNHPCRHQVSFRLPFLVSKPRRAELYGDLLQKREWSAATVVIFAASRVGRSLSKDLPHPEEILRCRAH